MRGVVSLQKRQNRTEESPSDISSSTHSANAVSAISVEQPNSGSRLESPSRRGLISKGVPRSTEAESISKRISQDIVVVPSADFGDSAHVVVACGFSASCSVEKCRQLMSFVGPVLLVERAPQIGTESNFVVAFATEDAAHMAVKQPLYLENSYVVVCKLLPPRPSGWSNFAVTSSLKSIGQSFSENWLLRTAKN